MKIAITLITSFTAVSVAFCAPTTKPTPATKPAMPAPTNPVAAARKAFAEAQADLTQATAEYNAAKAKAAEGIQQTPQWKQLVDAQVKAQTQYAAATQPVLDKVHHDPLYLAAQANKQKADEKLAELRASATVTGDQLTEATREQFASANAMKKFEDDALASDPAAKTAKANLDQANQALTDLKKQAEETTANDPQVQSAKAAVDEAQKKLDEANKALKEAIKNNAPQRNRPSPPPQRPRKGY
jgi:DNA repair exonuclease SbcCD ATPase subunit